MEGLELICFEIISSVGSAKSSYMEAIELAKQKKFDEAYKKIEEGDEAATAGHQAHMNLISKECAGETTTVTLLLLHAEDQLISAEVIKAMAIEVIELYKKIDR